MYKRLLMFLRCPDCGGTLDMEELGHSSTDDVGDFSEALLHCERQHWFPVVGGIPRLLPNSLQEHWVDIEAQVRMSTSEAAHVLAADIDSGSGASNPCDHRTQVNFSREWEHHELGDPTWGIELDDRVRWYFLEPIRIPRTELKDRIVLDAGCGNGSQSVAYTEFGAEVIAVDMSSGVELGHVFRRHHPGAQADRVHFVQADLQRPPIAPGICDVIHSAGVLHHTPSTEGTFRSLCPLLKPGGTFYMWVYKRERIVTPIVNALRSVTTRLPVGTFARIAGLLAPAFARFCWAADKVGLRSYPLMTHREASLGLLDIFGAPYAHYHSYPEVEAWYRSEGFDEVWPCNDDRRGFGVCGRRTDRPPGSESTR